jgi:hypothetical protein
VNANRKDVMFEMLAGMAVREGQWAPEPMLYLPVESPVDRIADQKEK